MDNSLGQKAYELAYDLDISYGECSQAALHALQSVYNIKDNGMFRAIGALAGGGLARCDGSCGAYCASIFFLGLFTGRDYQDLGKDPHDPAAHKKRDKLFLLGDIIYKKFIDSYGSIKCADIQRKLYGRAYFLRDNDDIDKFLANGGHGPQGGPGVCGNAAKWTVEALQQYMEKS